MCLMSLEKFAPARNGYQVKQISRWNGKLTGIFFSTVDGMEVGETYKARRIDIYATVGKELWGDPYKSGFHVFHKLSDAKKYKKYIEMDNFNRDFVIVRVGTGGKKTTGIQKFYTGSGPKDSVEARVTVSEYITIFEEVKTCQEKEGK